MAREGFCSKATNGKGSFLGANKSCMTSKSSMTNDELLSMLGIENKGEEQNVLGGKPAFYNDDNTLGNMLWRYSVSPHLQICLEMFRPSRPPRAPNRTYVPP